MSKDIKKTSVEICEERKFKQSLIVLILSCLFTGYIVVTHELPLFGSLKEYEQEKLEEEYGDYVDALKENSERVEERARGNIAYWSLRNNAISSDIDVEAIFEKGSVEESSLYNSVTLIEVETAYIEECAQKGAVECYMNGRETSYYNVDFKALQEYDIVITKSGNGIIVEMLDNNVEM